MQRKIRILLAILLIVMISGISLAAFAIEETGRIDKGETLEKSLFTAAQTIHNEGTIKGDLFAGGLEISSNGSIGGDFICVGQNITLGGDVAGDFLAGASHVDLQGSVAGDMRVVVADIVLNGKVGRNANLFAGTIHLGDNASIGGNLVAAGQDVRIDGKVDGNVRLDGQNITLTGEFGGDVDINLDGEPGHEDTRLVVLPGTVIKGKLTYMGVQEPEIHKGAVTGSYEWVKVEAASAGYQTGPTVLRYFLKFLKTIATAGIFFLIAMLIYKLFPQIFVRQGRVISEKPLGVFGVGLVAVISVAASAVLLVILTLLSLVLFSPSVAILFGAATVLFYLLLFLLSTIPAAMWLGNMMLGEKAGIPYRFALGLAVLTTGLFALNLLSMLPSIGFLLSILSFLAAFAVTVFGAGALLFGLKDIHHAVKNTRAFEQAGHFEP